MRVQVLDGIGRVYDLPATRVLVTGNNGTPAMVAVELTDDVVSCAHALDPEFAAVLAALGVDRTVAVATIRPRPAIDILGG